MAKAKETEVKPTEPAQAEQVYTEDDLLRNYKAFGAPREIVKVSLRLSGKKTMTFVEAKKIVDTFRKEK